MNEQLRPLNLSEILDRTAQLYRSRFLVFLGMAAIPTVTVFLLAAGSFAFIAWMGAHSRNGGSVANVLMWVFLALVLVLALPAGLGASALGEAAITEASARLFLGEKITIRAAYRIVWKRGWRYLGLYTLQILAIIVVPSVLFFIAVVAMVALKVAGAAANDNSPTFGGLAFLVLLVLGAFAVLVLLRLCLAFPASVVERATAWNALKRGRVLSRGTRARIFVLYLLGIVLNQVLSWGLMFPLLMVMAFVPALQRQAYAQVMGTVTMFVFYGAYFVVKALTKPVFGIALTLFYFDQRIRKEGFDIEWMMQQAGMVAPVPVPEPTVATISAGTAQAEEPTAGMAPDAVEIAVGPDAVSLPEVGMAGTPEEGKG